MATSRAQHKKYFETNIQFHASTHPRSHLPIIINLPYPLSSPHTVPPPPPHPFPPRPPLQANPTRSQVLLPSRSPDTSTSLYRKPLARAASLVFMQGSCLPDRPRSSTNTLPPLTTKHHVHRKIARAKKGRTCCTGARELRTFRFVAVLNVALSPFG